VRPHPALALALIVPAVALQESAGTRPGSLPASRPALEVATRIVLPERNQPLRVRGVEVPMRLLAERPPFVQKVPDAPAGFSYLTADILGHRILVAVADNPDGNTATVLADRDEDGDLTGAGERLTATIVRALPWLRYLSGLVFEFEDLAVQPLIQRTRLGPLTGVATAARHREGSVTIGGVGLLLVLIDADLDGVFGGAGDFWLLDTAERMWRTRLQALGPSNMIECDEPVVLGDRAIRLERIDPDGTARLAVGPAREPRSAYLARRAGRVRRAAEDLVTTDPQGLLAECGIDPARERAAEPPPWVHTLDLEAAKAAAARARKPLLLWFDAESKITCRFLERWVLEDRAVAEALRSFVPVRWNLELDETDLAAAWGIDRHPTVVMLAADGRIAHRIQGFMHPERFARELEQALRLAR
jgi:hypothetical protein